MSGRAVCPCCGSETDRPFVVDLTSNSISVDGETVRMQGREAEILFVLASAYPAPVSMDRLITRVYNGQEPERADVTIRTLVCRLRRRIAKLPLVVVTDPAGGYRLDPKPDSSIAVPLARRLRASSLHVRASA
jgi:DNA-binding response OmpR family regulator